MSHPEYLFNYFCPVNLSFLILKYYRTVVISEIEDGSDSPIKTVGTICKRIIKTVSYASCER